MLKVILLTCLFSMTLSQDSNVFELETLTSHLHTFFPNRSSDFNERITSYVHKNHLISASSSDNNQDDIKEMESCWSGANAELIHDYCLHMSDEKRTRMALALANCHLDRSTLQSYPCTTEMLLSECTKTMGSDITAFNVYTSLFVHVDNICHYFTQEAFELATKAAIDAMYITTLDAASSMQTLQEHSNKLTELSSLALEASRELQEKQDTLLKSTQGLVEDSATARVNMERLQENNAELKIGLEEHAIQQAAFIQATQDEYAALKLKLVENFDLTQQYTETSSELLESIVSRQSTLQRSQDQALISMQESTDLNILLKAGQDALLTTQAQTLNNVDKVQQALATGFENSEKALEEQGESIASATNSVQDLLSSQTKLQQLQSKLLADVEKAKETVSRIDAIQNANMEQTSMKLSNILQQSKDAEERLDTILGKLLNTTSRLLQLDLSIYTELMRLSSIFFYAITLIAAIAASTAARTRDARFLLLVEVLTCAFFEQYLSQAVLSLVAPAELDTALMTFTSYFRFSLVCILMMTCGYKAYTYANYSLLNHTLLLQNHVLLEALNVSLNGGTNQQTNNSSNDDIQAAMNAARAAVAEEVDVSTLVVPAADRAVTEAGGGAEDSHDATPKPKRTRKRRRN